MTSPEINSSELRDFALANVEFTAFAAELTKKFDVNEPQSPEQLYDTARLFAREFTDSSLLTASVLLEQVHQVVDPEDSTQAVPTEQQPVRTFDAIIKDITTAKNPESIDSHYITKNGDVSIYNKKKELAVDKTTVTDLYEELAAVLVLKDLSDDKTLDLLDKVNKFKGLNLDDNEMNKLFDLVAEVQLQKIEIEEELTFANDHLGQDIEVYLIEGGNLENYFVDANGVRTESYNKYDSFVSKSIEQIKNPLIEATYRIKSQQLLQSVVDEFRNIPADKALPIPTTPKIDQVAGFAAPNPSDKVDIPTSSAFTAPTGSRVDGMPDPTNVDSKNPVLTPEEKIDELTKRFLNKVDKNVSDALVGLAEPVTDLYPLKIKSVRELFTSTAQRAKKLNLSNENWVKTPQFIALTNAIYKIIAANNNLIKDEDNHEKAAAVNKEYAAQLAELKKINSKVYDIKKPTTTTRKLSIKDRVKAVGYRVMGALPSNKQPKA